MIIIIKPMGAKKRRNVVFSKKYYEKESCQKRLLALLSLSVCPPASNNWDVTGRIFIKFGIQLFFENLYRKFSFIKIWQE